uniref:P-type domain-containing protein n=1 Tax=Pelusios castaneus TaxID=367368 RepID=A0A8C8SMD3_9SAUR
MVWCSLSVFFPGLVLAQPFHSSACPTTISEDLRRDCHPEPGATEAACLNRGCRWCETSTPYIPFCFYDSNEDATCPSTIPVQRRIDCHPQLGASKESCEAKGCIWCSTKVSNAPWCSFPEDIQCHCLAMIFPLLPWMWSSREKTDSDLR